MFDEGSMPVWILWSIGTASGDMGIYSSSVTYFKQALSRYCSVRLDIWIEAVPCWNTMLFSIQLNQTRYIFSHKKPKHVLNKGIRILFIERRSSFSRKHSLRPQPWTEKQSLHVTYASYYFLVVDLADFVNFKCVTFDKLVSQTKCF